MTSIEATISRLAHLAPSPHPVISLFINTGPDGRGRPNFPVFLKKAFADRIRTFPNRSTAREQLERDRNRIIEYLSDELDPAVQAAACYASEAEGLWEAHTFRTAFDRNRLVVGPVPHLYPLIKLVDGSPRYAVCVVDVHQARIVVCGLGSVLTESDFEPPEPIDRTRVAGWAEIRYQARIEHHIQKYAREIVDRLDRIVAAREVDYVILGGDDKILGELRRFLGPAIKEKIIDEDHIPADTTTHEIMKRTIALVRETGARDTRRLADTMIDRFRAGGLAVAGLDPTIEALNREQVDQLVIDDGFNGQPGWQCPECRVLGKEPVPNSCPFCETPMPEQIDLREAMVRRARRTGRRVEIVSDHDELLALDGVGALLRYRA